MKPRSYAGAAMVLTAASLWGTLGLYSRILSPMGFSPLELASVRTSIGVAGLLLWLGVRAAARNRPPGGEPSALARARTPADDGDDGAGAVGGARTRSGWWDVALFAAYGLVSVATFQFVYFETIERTTVPVAAALLYTAPAFVVLISRVTLGEPLRRARLLALATVLLGVLLVTGAGRAVAAGTAPLGAGALVFGLAAGFTYAMNTIFGKLALRRYGPTQTVLYAFCFGAIFLAIASPPWEVLLRRADAVPFLIALGLIPTLVAYTLYIAGLRHLPAGAAAMLATAEPVVAAMVGALFLAESLTPDQMAGVALILTAALILSRRPAV